MSRPSAALRLKNRKNIEKIELEKLEINYELITETNNLLNNYYNISLREKEIKEAVEMLEKLSKEAVAEYHLSKDEWIVAGIAGIIGAVMDICLVKLPKNPKLEDSQTGTLVNYIKGKLTPDNIKELEEKNWVPYDAPYSKNYLETAVDGLGTRTHRLHSLGHDPVLGFVFGVKDILNGTFTGIDKNGRYIVSNILSENKNPGISLFQAITKQIGHLKSDIGTSAGLPAPFMGLLQFCQFGTINGTGNKTHNIAEISRVMYMNGYNLEYFAAGTIPVISIEIIIRMYYIFKKFQRGATIENPKEWLPFSKVKVDKMLLVAHTIALGGNVIKVGTTNNILGLNISQYIAFFYQVSKELRRTMKSSEEVARNEYVMKYLDKQSEEVDEKLKKELERLGLEE